jgi:purine-nucleoside phosphorylase
LTTYLRPTAPIAADVLAPADPGLALTLAQELLGKPLMANHNHGLWGYTGTTASGAELGIQSTGIGGPSAAAVLGELAAHGTRRVIRVGRCLAVDGTLAPSTVVIAERALGGDGISRAIGAGSSHPDPGLLAALERALGPGAERVVVAGSDLPAAGDAPPAWREAGARAADLETAAMLALGAELGVAVAGALIVDGTDEDLIALGRVCAAAFAAAPPDLPADRRGAARPAQASGSAA